MAKVLVTGGAGFLGSHLVEALIKSGDRVSVLDDLSAGRKENIADFNCSFYKGSVADSEMVNTAIGGCDVVYHLATPCLVKGLEDPGLMHRVGDWGTFNVCLSAKASGAKFIYISSSEIYGNQDIFPIREDAEPRPVSLYGLTKLMGERYVDFFHRIHGVPSVTIRPFNIFGEKHREDDYACVVTSFLKRAAFKRRPIVYGDGSQRRDFTHISDTVAGIMLLSKLSNGEVVNLGTGEDYSVLQIADLVYASWGYAGTPPKPIFRHVRPHDVRCLRADTSLAKSYGYEPRLSLEMGLQKYVDWFRASRRLT